MVGTDVHKGDCTCSGNDVVVVGRIQGAYGIRGWVHVAAFTDPIDNILGYRPWLLSSSAEPVGWEPLEVEEIRPHKQGFVAGLHGVRDRNEAQRLSGRLIGVPAAALPPAGSDEFYWRDLIGLAVVGQDGKVLGAVTSLLETGAHDVLVVRPEAGDDGADELLIPFHARYVIAVDREAGEIRVDWQDAGGA
ncbi:MAG: ribosome maturation factor RimM [Pseudomonadales bacterium]|jgi:16S rRNA processing protein RimM